MIDIPTRSTESTLSLIDLFYLNNPDNVICHGTLPKIADHDGICVSFNVKTTKQSQKTKIIYDYKNADTEGLISYIKSFDFENMVFNKPTINQADIYSDILKQAFAQFVPCKTVVIRTSDMAWCNKYTRLLLRKKNRNYQLYKKYNCDYINHLNKPNPKPDIVTRLLNNKKQSLYKSKRGSK